MAKARSLEFGDKTRFADARFADDGNDLSLPMQNMRQGCVKPCHLSVPTGQLRMQPFNAARLHRLGKEPSHLICRHCRTLANEGDRTGA